MKSFSSNISCLSFGKSYIHTYRRTDVGMDGQTDIQTDRLTVIQTDRKACRQAGSQTERQAEIRSYLYMCICVFI